MLDSGGMKIERPKWKYFGRLRNRHTIRVVASNKRNILIDVDSGVNIRNNTTNITIWFRCYTNRGTITINDGTRDRLVIDANDITMTDESGNTYI